MRLITRAEWGARPPRSVVSRNFKDVSTCHWNGPIITVGGSSKWQHETCAALVRGIQNYHMDWNGWNDIAYNFVECPHGYTFEGRGFDIVNAANGTNTANRMSHAIMCLAGDGNEFSDYEKVGFRNAVFYISSETKVPSGCIGHRDWVSTDCPGDERYNWVHQGMPISDSVVPEGGLIVNGANRAQGGYTLVGPDGGVFCYEGAPYFGSLPELGVQPNAPIVDMTWTLTGNGYWLMGEDGGIFNFGDAPYNGSYLGLPSWIRNDPNRRFGAIVARVDGGYTEWSRNQEHYDF